MAKSIGQRVTLSGREGVVVHTQFDGTNDRQECEVKWDCGGSSWEMGEDLKRVPNVSGDAFTTMANGFGVRVDETTPINAVAKVRDKEYVLVGDMLGFYDILGLAKVRHAKVITPARQVTLDIQQRIAHGVPTKGGSNGRHDPRRIGLAKAAALDEPMLVRKGPLMRACTLTPFETSITSLSRAINLSHKNLTRKQKRMLRKERKQ